MEPGGHDSSCSPRSGDAAQQGQQAQHRSHGISAKALHHGATAYPSEMQLQQVKLGPPSALKLVFELQKFGVFRFVYTTLSAECLQLFERMPHKACVLLQRYPFL